MKNPENILKKLNIILPNPPNPVANYVPIVETGDLLFVSGNGPGLRDDKTPYSGKPNLSISEEDAIAASYSVGLNILSQVKKHTGNLNKINRVIRVFGMINSTYNFENHSKIIDACSNLFTEIFGESGIHSRTSIGMGSLPFEIPVEIETIFELKN
ncbi:MAG: RidA family protein [SAR202 cluster bacterium]|nr:RidA family protein [SAR202 cluster bacterium]|tara:strand:+ start:6403 stop:6870 length:468 start_codon:yes stop_codon:yes gene_type:complete